MIDSSGDDRTASETKNESTSRSARRRIAGNIASMLVMNITRRGTMFVIYILVGRYLGALHFGQLALASTLLYSWHQCAVLGMTTLVTRDVARNPELTATHFLHSGVIGLLASGIGTAVVVPFVMIMGYQRETSEVILIMFLGLVPLVLSQISEGIFQAWERMDLVACVNVPICLLKIAAVAFAIRLEFGIRDIAISLTVLQFAVMFLQWLAFLLWRGVPRVQFCWGNAINLVRSSSVFFGIQATNAIKNAATVTVLSKFGGETSVGIYVAAGQLLAPFSLIFNSVAFALFPAMCRGFDKSMANLYHVLRGAIEGIMVIAVPAVVGLFLLADDILVFIYQDQQFLLSATVLRIIAWTLIVHVLTSVTGQMLWASSHEKVSLKISVINTVVHCTASIVLIIEFGVVGAAIAALLTSTLSLVQHIIPTARLQPGIGAGILAAISKPLIASLAMAAFLAYGTDRGLIVTIPWAVILYFTCLTGLFVTSAGGLSQFLSRYTSLWTTR